MQVDAEHVVSFKRTILDFRIEALPGEGLAGRRLAAIHIVGSAFLWHQVRRRVLGFSSIHFVGSAFLWPQARLRSS